jgi:hypothetical protein
MLIAIASPLFSQGSAGRIQGVVTDQTGGVLAGAKVTITDTQRGVARTLTTDASGAYNAPNLLPGTYTVRAELSGFSPLERQNVILEVAKEVRVDMVLSPGAQTQSITVTEALPLVETTNATLGGTITNETLAELPLNGRNFANLLQLRPGVTIYPGGSGWTQSSNGMRAKDNIYLVDGIYSSEPWMGQSVMNAVGAAGDAGTILSLDSIDEFKTEQNPRAQYGWKPGSIVNVGIKSGTNAIHGTGFAFGRDGKWDPLNYFQASGTNNGKAQPKTPVQLEQFGGTVGGPIVKDKLFYFASYEGQRYTIGSTGQITEPITAAGIYDPTQVNGQPRDTNLIAACQAALAIGAPGSGIPGGLTALSAQLAGLSNNCTPLPNYPGLFPVNSGANFTTVSTNLPTHNSVNSGVGKVDYHLNDKHSLNAMYFISPGDGIFNDDPSGQTNQLWETFQHFRSMVFAGNWTYTPNSAWVNEARVGFSHYDQSFLSGDNNQDPANYTFNGNVYNLNTGQTNPFYFGLPSINVGDAFTAYLGAGWPKIVGPDGTLQIVDNISYLRGQHSFKFGGEILRFQSTTNVTSGTKGPLAFDSLQDFFAGFPSGPPGCGGKNNALGDCPGDGSARILAGNLQRHFTQEGYSLFVQDDWRIRPRLVLNLGLRYELNTVQKERDNLQGRFDPLSATGVVQVGSGLTSVYNGDHNNFGPRVGLAWDIFGNGKTVIRAGGGIMYEQVSLDVFNGIGNSFGLRVPPTGVPLCSNGSCQPGVGNINVVNVSFTDTPVISDFSPGAIPYQWANNGPSTPIYSLLATASACGDGSTPIPGGLGFVPTQCSAMLVDPNFRTPYVSTWTLGIQRQIVSNISLEVAYVGNHGTKLIHDLSINQATPVTYTNVGAGIGTITTGPGWTAAKLVACATAPSSSNCKPSTALEQAGRPYNAKFPYFKYVDYFGNLDSSNYNGVQAVLTVRNFHGLGSTVGYTYSHALGSSSDQGTSGGLVIPINSYGNLHNQLYSSTTFDLRHRLTVSANYALPEVKTPAQLLQGWSLNATVLVQSGTPWGVNDSSTDFAGTGEQRGNPSANQGSQWTFLGSPSDFTPHHNYDGVTPGPTGAPGVPWFPGSTNLANSPTASSACNSAASARGPLAVASLRVLGCYAMGSSVLIPAPYGGYGNGTRNLFTGEGYRNLDMSIAKRIKITERLSAQFRAEFFNFFNHPTFTNPSGGPGGNAANTNAASAGKGSGLGVVPNTPDQAGSNPVLGSGGARHIQLGLKILF